MKGTSSEAPARALVIGAGSAGELVVREIRSASHTGLVAAAFVDDDQEKIGRSVEGVPVIATTHDIAQAAGACGAQIALLAMPSAGGEVVRRIARSCAELGLPLRTIPSLVEIISGRLKASAIRDISAEDLLRRAPVLRLADADLYLRGSVVLVTGAGGSIGRELCREALRSGPSRLVLLDSSENALYEIDRQLRLRSSSTEIVPVLASVRDLPKLQRLFGRFRPEVVFHTAAHKHVPLTETNPDEAVLTNIFGTENVLLASESAGTSRIVHISTDKAVSATGVMGLTKRVAELLIRRRAGEVKATPVVVRFGNVLGSSGSVVPLFKEQIAAGGPLTVGHPELERFFMTIEEAASLVIEAGAFGERGEIYVLDMGEPVRIVALAEDLIRLSGLRPGRDIRIEFTGLRPGEAMKEALFLDEEAKESTRNPRILLARCAPGGPLPSQNQFEALRRAAESGDSASLPDMLRSFIRATPAFDLASRTRGGT